MRIHAIVGALAISLIGLPGFSAKAQDYPNRPIRLVVPFAAGGAVDVVARILAPRLSSELGQSVVVENRLGAAGAIGAAAVAKSEPDGYTLLFTANSTHTTVPHVSKTPYDPLTDFTPVATVLDYSFVLVANAKSSIMTVADLLAYGRQHPDRMNYSSAGVGSGPHLAAELLQAATGVRMQHIPYSGNAPAMTALISGEVAFLFDTTGTAISYVTGGQVRALAVTSASRNAMLPEVPTMIEAGIKGFEVVGWYGLMGPPKLPDLLTDRLAKTVHVAMADSAVQDQLRRRGFDIRISPKAEFASRLKADHALWGKAVAQARLGK
ncbi:MAG: tripartite tricarboxylate transporter substrate binding protein [Hyphomicrobiales bacterium]|nr:tripartite tricarboxylate transporter substrate binding protein [Hyphomicrobiales bacterium]